MKTLLLSLCFFLFFSDSFSQSVGIGTTSPSPTALLDLSSSNKGLLPPRLSTTERDAIQTPVAGLVIYNSSINKLQYFNGTTWSNVDEAGTSNNASGGIAVVYGVDNSSSSAPGYAYGLSSNDIWVPQTLTHVNQYYKDTCSKTQAVIYGWDNSLSTSPGMHTRLHKMEHGLRKHLHI